MRAFHNNEAIKEKYKGHEKAEKSVEVVRKYFQSRGFCVTSKSSSSSKGFDLVAIKGTKSLKVEVKTAFRSARAWKVGKSHDLKNDFIAIVFGDQIHFEEWTSHISKCSKNGTRSLTKIAELYV